MKFQQRKFTCGPAAICNALEVYGVYLAEDEVATACKTTPEGTSPRGIIRGVVAAGFWPQPIKYRDSLKAIGLLDFLCKEGIPAILCVDKWQHWIALVGKMGDKYVIADSASNHLMEFRSMDAMATWWRYTGSRFEGFAIQQKEISNVLSDLQGPVQRSNQEMSNSAKGHSTDESEGNNQ